MAVKRYWLWVLGTSTLVAAAVPAQTYYKWTDEQGIVHFADSPPPPHSGKVEERQLPAEPAVKPHDSEAGAEGAAQQAAATPESAGGPARVILVSRKLPRTGPSSMHILGEVKNVGGANAQRVAVTISAVDSTAGTPCLSEEATVSPSTLGPGQSGNFDVDVDSPCLNGQPNVDVAPVWD